MRWNNNLAYAIGLIATDGSLSKDGRHLELTSKDLEQIKNFTSVFGLNNKIGLKKSTYNKVGKYYRVQFGNKQLYKFLLSVGLFPNKSKTLGPLKIHNKYFRDYLRGFLDGDGFTYSYRDKRWKNSFMLYMGFVSASRKHLTWIQSRILELFGLSGTIKSSGRSAYQLMYAKRASLCLVGRMYYSKSVLCLSRKKYKILKALDIIANMREC